MAQNEFKPEKWGAILYLVIKIATVLKKFFQKKSDSKDT